MGRGLVKSHLPDTVHLRKLFAEAQGLLVAYVLHHDAGGAVGGKFPLHEIQSLPGFGILGQVVRDALIHPDPVA